MWNITFISKVPHNHEVEGNGVGPQGPSPKFSVGSLGSSLLCSQPGLPQDWLTMNYCASPHFLLRCSASLPCRLLSREKRG